MKAQNKTKSVCDVKVEADGNSLRLSFPKRHTPLWETLKGKSLKGKPNYLYLTKYGYSAGNPEDWKRASQLAIALEADLDHPEWEKLFDPTLAKYGLGGGKYAKLADVLQMPGIAQQEPEITVGEMWEAYLEWKKTVIEETTFKARYGALTNVINGKVWIKERRAFITTTEPLSRCRIDDKKSVTLALNAIVIAKKSQLTKALSEAFDLCRLKGLLSTSSAKENPFLVNESFAAPAVTTQQKYASKIVNGEEKEWYELRDDKSLEGDRRSFTKEERNTIIEAFYASNKWKHIAGMIEFYFLTGCRTAEALPLMWKDIDLERGVIKFSKSLGTCTKTIKDTKTGEIRLFYFSNNSRLKELLLELKEQSLNELVFAGKNGKILPYHAVVRAWCGNGDKRKLADGETVKYYYPGVVTQLAEQGLISSYLSPYHTRHTYITLTAHANAHNNNALLHIATSCGNSVDVILRHYLGVSESVEIVEA